MIKVHPLGLDRARVEFSDETSRGVSYRGSYHALLKNGAWQGDDHGREHRAFDAPLNTYTALSAYRSESLNAEVSSPAKKLLATRCLEAVISFYAKETLAVVNSELERLESVYTRAEEESIEAQKEAKTKLDLASEAFQALRTFQKEHNIK